MAAVVPKGNPKDSMKSTWRTDKSQWGPIHWIIDTLYVYDRDLNRPPPVFQKSDPVPWLSEISCHRWVIIHAMWPVLVQGLYIYLTGHNFHPIAAFFFYVLAMQLNSVHEIHALRRLGYIYGYFDGDKSPRDEVPDHGVAKTFTSLQLTTTVRPLVAIFLTYRRNEPPSFSWWLPVELGLYSIILDGWFYLYHRSCHELDTLWKYHRTHHLTKHPSPLLSSYADEHQEFIELALVPFLSWATLRLMGFPMGFHDWWMCHEYIIFTEPFGHSGLRLYASTVGTANWLLKLFNAELTIEDHDLHHRKGWKHSYNYGKQTRLWDKLFGTCHPRVEGFKANVDWEKRVDMPWF